MGKILLNVAKVQGDASDSLLKHLQEHSELLQQQMSEFSLISQNFETKFAYETKPTPVAGAIPIVVISNPVFMINHDFFADLTVIRLYLNGPPWFQEHLMLQNLALMQTTEI